jgi:uncharacterized membrane protein YhaH (DUF805 family)
MGASFGGAMSSWDYVKQAWKLWTNFGGRARRKEYWYFQLCPLLFIFIVMIIAAIVIPNLARAGQMGPAAEHQPMSLPTLLILYVFLGGFLILYVRFLIASLAVSVRRLHDTNHSGWWVLFGVIPLIGPVYMLILHCTDSDPGDNQYGPNPKLPAAFNPGLSSVNTR